MAPLRRHRWRALATVAILCLAASACGGSSADPVVAPITSDGSNTSTNDPAITTDNPGGDAADVPLPSNAVPGYDPRICATPTTCPEEVRPNTWIGIEPSTPQTTLPLAGSRILTKSSAQIRVWDVDNVLNGETLIIAPPFGAGFNNKDAQLLPDGRVVVEIRSGSRIAENAIAIYDLQADNPGEPVTIFDANTADFVALTDGRVLTFGEERASIWDPASPSEPVETVNYQAPNRGFGRFGKVAAAPDGGFFWHVASNEDGGLWQWTPQTGAALVVDYSTRGLSADKIKVLSNQYVTEPTTRGPLSLVDLETKEVIELSVPETISADQVVLINPTLMPDGRVLASADKVGDIYLWDLDRPDEPTLIVEGDRNVTRPEVYDIAVLDDGRVVIASAVTSADGDRITQYEILSDI